MSLSTDEREDSLVAEVVLNVVGVNLRAVDFRGEGVRDARRMDISCREARALGGGRCGHGRAAGELLRHEAATLGEPLRMRRHGGDVLELGVGVHDEAVVDIDDFFPQDNRGAFQRETVECGGNRPLDGVLLRDNTELAAAAVDAIEDLVEGGALDKVGALDAEALREGERRLVRVRAGWAEECNGVVGRFHGWATPWKRFSRAQTL